MNAFAAGAPRKPDPMVSPTMPAPAPVQPVDAQGNAFKAAASPMQPNYTMPQPKPQPSFAGNAFGAFLKGFAGPERIQAVDDQRKAETKDRLTKTLAWLQQTAQLPQDQRMQFTMQNADAIMADTNVDPRKGLGNAFARQNAAGQFSDESLQRGIAAISAQLGMSPAKPEPMSAYEAAKLKMEQDKAARDAGAPIKMGEDTLLDPNTYQPLYQGQKPPKAPETTMDGTMMWDAQQGKFVPIEGAEAMYRRLHPQQPSGGAVGQFYTLTPEEVKAAGYVPGTVVQKDSRGAMYVRSRPSTQQTGQPTESERTAGLQATISLHGLKKVVEMEAEGYDRASLGAQSTFGMGEKEKLYDQAATEFIDGYLRAMTGATAPPAELDGYKRQWFPQFGDQPSVVLQKAQGRLNALRAMKTKAGRSWNSEWDALLNQLESQIGSQNAQNPQNAQKYTPEQVAKAKQMLAMWNQLPGSFQTPALKAKMEEIAGVSNASAPLAPPVMNYQSDQAGPSNVPQDAINELMQDPSPDSIAQFNEVFGDGSAEAILNGPR